MYCNQIHELATDVADVQKNQRRVLSVVVLTSITMVVEIIAGRMTGSIALEADGYHMASHAGALGIAYLAYRMMAAPQLRSKLNFGSGKVLALGGYSSAIGLAAVAVWMLVESVSRFFSPKQISYDEALVVTVAGLMINLLSAWLLGWGARPQDEHGHHHSCSEHHHQEEPGHVHHHHHHDEHFHAHHHHHHHHHDHNHQGALMHVLADALTSVLAIIALSLGRYFPQAAWLDPLIGCVGAVVILRWSWGLLRQTSMELLDCYPAGVSLQDLKDRIEKDGHQVWDLHLWSQGRGALVGVLSVTPTHEGADFRSYFSNLGTGIHLSVEKVPR